MLAGPAGSVSVRDQLKEFAAAQGLQLKGAAAPGAIDMI